MLEDRDERSTAWTWLRGFAYFLLAWPLLSLFALDQFELDDWQSVVLAIFGPAAIGVVLLGIERGLTWLFRNRLKRRQPVPSTLRDLSNLGLALAILLVVDVAIVTIADDEQIVTGGDPETANFAIMMLAICGGVAMVFRVLHRLVYGPERIVDLGEGWDRAPNVMRFMGYLTLIPVLLVCTVMIDYTLHRRPDFGLGAWISLPALLWLGLRSAMAQAPRWWARNPWEAWIRRNSLALPWWVIAVVFGLALGVLFLLLPTGLIDGEGMTMGGRIAAGVVGIPLGLIVLFGVGMTLFKGLPTLLREWRAAMLLNRRPDELVGWVPPPKPESSEVLLRLRDGREVAFDMGEETPVFLAHLARGVKP
jgi:hypothetical protein